MPEYQHFNSFANLREWVARARSVRLEVALARRGLKPGDPCPRCGSRLKLNVATQVWTCAQHRGDVVGLVEHLDGTNFVGACRALTGTAAPKHDT